MGTSKGMETPSNGGWTAVKRGIPRSLGGSSSFSSEALIGGVINSSGGLGSGGSGGGGGGGASVGGAVSGLGGFGAAVGTGGLDAGIERLGLDELKDKTAIEVVAAVAEHLAEHAEGPHHDLLETALRDAILECAAIEADGSYEDLDTSLQGFLSSEGIEGLIESFLSHFVFDRIWSWVEQHATQKVELNGDTLAMASAVKESCRGHVEQLMDDIRDEGRFGTTDWFGQEGKQLAEGIVGTLEFRLSLLSSEE
ncbi:hypothetical protein Mal65_16030 [Crateriforma conspicua]|nr:hypothetical protein Mal65_16030 [Crateriforma conspicua]